MKTTLLGAGLALAVVAGCSGGAHSLSVSSRASVAPTGATTTTTTAGPLDLGNGISIARIRMVVRSIEAEPQGCTASGTSGTDGTNGTTGTSGTSQPAAPTVASADATGGSGDDAEADGGDDCEVAAGPALVDLSGSDLVAGTLHWVASVTLPDGTYKGIEFKIMKLPLAQATTAGLQEMANLQASIVVDGTVDGQAFQFTTPWEVEQEHEGAFTVGAGSTPNMTLDFDPSGWFGTSSARLDPRDPTNQGAIFANIRASIRLYGDDDRDGCDDQASTGCTPTTSHD